MLFSACSFSSEPLLAGQRPDIGEDHSPSGGNDPGDRARDGGSEPVVPKAGSGGSGQSAGAGGAPAAGAAANDDGGAAGSNAGADATVEDSSTAPDPTPDAAPDPDPPDPEPDAATEPDAGTPPDDCPPCVCPHELKAALNQPRTKNCPLVGCATAECAPEPTCTLSKLGARGYYICDDPHTWQAAKDHCDSVAGTSLASIDDREEDEFLLAELDDKTWVGGNDLDEEGEFVWDHGDAFWSGGAEFFDGPQGPGPGGGGPGPQPGWESGGAVNDAYTNWLSYEPNDQGLDDSGGDCVMLWPEQDSWADASCEDPHGYVCEFVLPAP